MTLVTPGTLRTAAATASKSASLPLVLSTEMWPFKPRMRSMSCCRKPLKIAKVMMSAITPRRMPMSENHETTEMKPS